MLQLLLLLQTGEGHPSIVLHLIDRLAHQGGFHTPHVTAPSSWCSCLQCRDMYAKQDVLALPQKEDNNKGKRHVPTPYFFCGTTADLESECAE